MPFYRARKYVDVALRPQLDQVNSQSKNDVGAKQSHSSILRHSLLSNTKQPAAVGVSIVNGVKARRSVGIRAVISLALPLVITLCSCYYSFLLVRNNSLSQTKRRMYVRLETPKKIESSELSVLQQDVAIHDRLPTVARIESSPNTCEFRAYPSNRLYGLFSKIQPSFLSDAAYIRGKWPIIINPTENDYNGHNERNVQQSSPVKICLNTSSWENLVDAYGVKRLPFTDGHNPSVISLASNPYSESLNYSEGNLHARLDPKNIQPIVSAFSSYSIETLFLGISIFGNGQCKFGLSVEDVEKYRFSVYNEPPNGKRTLLSILSPLRSLTNSDIFDHQSLPFRTLMQTTLLLELDALYGTSRKALQPQKKDAVYLRTHQEFDDPRLFFHGGNIWVLYRNGPLFGYNDQIHNPIHFEEIPNEDGSGSTFVAYIKASETVRVCCGRNIALISEESKDLVSKPKLKALTWVDPVTVIDVKLADEVKKPVHVISHDTGSILSQRNHRRLGDTGQKLTSNIHGTNGYMLPLPASGELLGVAHFHRPENRHHSKYALHGHHYTHVFFTIMKSSINDTEEYSSRPFRLNRISNEFVFRSLSLPMDSSLPPVDADIIQFASGLDLVGNDVNGTLIISYGINDCEGAVFTMKVQKIQEMLIQVLPGQEVVDLMQKVTVGV